ncbi:MAG: hypothetical protein WCD18_02975, partial [Thermosynechococcaceae cyanobacterium]
APKVLRPPGSVSNGANVLVIDSEGIGKKPEKSTPERAKPSRVDSFKPRTDTPPEVISVAMTPKEQDVFAFMGISPLVLFEGEVKNPRTAVIQVRFPDQEEAHEGAPLNLAEAEVEPEAIAMSHNGQSELAPSPLDLEVPSVPMPTPLAVASEVGVETAEDLVQDDVSNGPRRRRRRTSAEMSGDRQLSLGTEA